VLGDSQLGVFGGGYALTARRGSAEIIRLETAVDVAQDAYLVALVCINAYFLTAVLANIVYLRRATRQARTTTGPLVSVIVPARNEEHTIAACLETLLAQDYADYEVIVVDDESEDGTARVVAALAAENPRLQLVSSGPLPADWFGKPYALCQGAKVARGEILLFTDADTDHERRSLSWAVTNIEEHKADLLSGYLNQRYRSLGDSIVVPVLYAMMLLVPFYLLPRTRSPRLAFSIGQYVAVRRKAFEAIGGFEDIKDSILDDMALAIRMKEAGYREVFLDARSAASCHMYAGFRDASAGIKRSVYSAVGGHPMAALLVSALVLGIIIVPAACVLAALVRLEMPTGPCALAAALFVTQWALLAWDRNVPLVAIAAYPLVFLNLVLMLNASMLQTGFGRGVYWKGRLVRVPKHVRAAHRARVAER